MPVGWGRLPSPWRSSGDIAAVTGLALDQRLAGEGRFLDLHAAGGRAALGQADLADHGVGEVVPKHLFTHRVHEDHGAVAAVRLALHDLDVPVPDLRRAGEATLERDGRRLRLARELGNGDLALLVDVRVVDDLDLARDARHRGEVGDDADTIDVEQHVALKKRIGRGHRMLPFAFALVGPAWLLGDLGTARELGDAEDHELGRLHRRDPDVDDQLARVPDL